MKRLAQIGIIGSNDSASSKKQEDFAEELGRALVDNNYRIVCGGCGGVMRAACKGAKSSQSYLPGDTIGILPSLDGKEANEYVDVKIPTGIGYARNQIVVSTSDILVAIGGGAGTLSEIAMAWQMGKEIIAVDIGEGWSSKLAGTQIDSRISKPIGYALTVEDVLFFIDERLPYKTPKPLPGSELIDDKYAIKTRFRTKTNREHYEIKEISTERTFALKSHIKRSELDWAQFENEITITKSLDHPGIIKIWADGEITLDGITRRYAIMDWHSKTLADVDMRKYDVQSVLAIIDNFLEICIYLEEKGIVHHDIKHHNLFLNQDTLEVTMFDFYRAVQYLDREEYQSYVRREDMFNSGKLLLYVMTGEWVYRPTNIETLPSYDGWDTDSIKDLIGSMVDGEPERRPSSFKHVRECLNRYVGRGG